MDYLLQNTYTVKYVTSYVRISELLCYIYVRKGHQVLDNLQIGV